MTAKIVLVDRTPALAHRLSGPLADAGHAVRVVGEDAGEWPLHGAGAADLVVHEVDCSGRAAAAPGADLDLEQAGYLPLVVLRSEVWCRPESGEAGAWPSPAQGAASPAELVEHVGTLLTLQRAVLRREGAAGDGEGLHSRALFHSYLAREFGRSGRHDAKVSCVLASLGGAVGLPSADSLTHRTAWERAARGYHELLRQCVRSSDFVCKYDGSTFALLLDETDMEGAWQCIDRLSGLVESRGYGRLEGQALCIRARWKLAAYCRCRASASGGLRPATSAGGRPRSSLDPAGATYEL